MLQEHRCLPIHTFRMDDHVSGAHQWRMDAGQPTKGHTPLPQQGVEHTSLLVVHQHIVRDSFWIPNSVDCRVHSVRRAHQKHPGSF